MQRTALFLSLASLACAFGGDEPTLGADLAASDDPAVIERGAALAFGPAHCGACHLADELQADVASGERPPLSGGRAIRTPFGTFHTPNLTPDVETGIGGLTDDQLVGALRHNVGRDGRGLAPFMQFQDLSDEDLVAILSFLRAQVPVRNPVPPHDLGVAARLLRPLLATRVDPEEPPPRTSPAGATVERGEYLANEVAGCVRCHSPLGPTRAIAGEPFSGGNEMRSELDPDVIFVPPNLTPDPETGVLVRYSEDLFVARFQSGAAMPGTHMPWAYFASMPEEDLRAIYRYLSSLPPVRNDTGPSVRQPER